jgi:hypothetical protein
MTDAIALSGIEKEHLARLRYGFVFAEVTDVRAAIWEDKMRRSCMLLRALVTTTSLTAHVTQCDAGSLQQRMSNHLR